MRDPQSYGRLVKSSIKSELFKIVVCYSTTNPDDEKGKKRVDCFYADTFRVMIRITPL